jgi:hypothetical protein
MDPAFFHALSAADFLPDGHYRQDTVTLEDGLRRAGAFNAAVDAYAAAGVDGRPPGEVEAAAKIAPDGGPLFYRCAACSQPLSEGGRGGAARPLWCPSCRAAPFCSERCARLLAPQHRAVCGQLLTRPLLLSQVALRCGLEAHAVGGLQGPALAQAVVRQLTAVQRSYQAARTAASVSALIDE